MSDDKEFRSKQAKEPVQQELEDSIGREKEDADKEVVDDKSRLSAEVKDEWKDGAEDASEEDGVDGDKEEAAWYVVKDVRLFGGGAVAPVADDDWEYVDEDFTRFGRL